MFLLHKSRRSPSSAGSKTQQFQVLPQGTPGAAGMEYWCDVCETSRAITVCPSCVVSLCQACCDDIHTRGGYQLHSLVPMDEFMAQLEVIGHGGGTHPRHTDSTESELEVFGSGEHQPRQCKVHRGESTEFLCEVCCEEVCRQCSTNGEHREHECRLLVDLALEKREALHRMIDDVNDCHAEWNKGFDDCHELRERLFVRQNTLESTIKSHFHSIHSSLHSKEEQLLAVVRSEMETRSQQLNNQAE